MGMFLNRGTKEFESVIELMHQGKLDLVRFAKEIEMTDVQTSLENFEKGLDCPIKFVIKMND